METSEAFPDNKTNLADPAKLAEENPKSCHRSTRGQIGNLGTLQNQIHLGFPVSVLLDGSPAKVYLSHWRDLLEESCFHKPLNRQSKSHAGAKIQKKERREKKKYIRCSIKAISEFQKFSLSNWGLVQSLSYENDLYLHESKIIFVSIASHLASETEAWGNSEMGNCRILTN